MLVDAAPKILPEIPPRLGEYAARQLEKQGVEIHVSTTLESYDGTRRASPTAPSSRRARGLDRRRPRASASWRARAAARRRGRVRVDETYGSRDASDVWALGDCAAVPNARTPGDLDPPTSQHALRQARRLAKNLTGPPRPYGYRMLGQVATLGHYKGIAEILGMRLRGFLGWFVTRTYHLYQLPLLTRKLRVVADWTLALFFRRDIVELSMLGHPRRLGE